MFAIQVSSQILTQIEGKCSSDSIFKFLSANKNKQRNKVKLVL